MYRQHKQEGNEILTLAINEVFDCVVNCTHSWEGEVFLSKHLFHLKDLRLQQSLKQGFFLLFLGFSDQVVNFVGDAVILVWPVVQGKRTIGQCSQLAASCALEMCQQRKDANYSLHLKVQQQQQHESQQKIIKATLCPQQQQQRQCQQKMHQNSTVSTTTTTTTLCRLELRLGLLLR